MVNSYYRVGIGFDSHSLTEGRDLYLGGVKIDYPRGLLGHSDGDVVIHSLIDALMGASGSNDIGELFPSDDEKYKNISSLTLLRQAYSLTTKSNYKIANIDIVVIADEPRISSFKDEIRGVLSEVLNISKGDINIKGKTSEGFLSSGDFISSITVVLLYKEGR
ncbi:MAG: 2-C-methyl-D-erythritol 2,4-cyclodiphosphate synthase [bacterium]